MAQWFRRSEPPRSSSAGGGGGGGGPFSSDRGGEDLDDGLDGGGGVGVWGGGGGGGGGRRRYTDSVDVLDDDDDDDREGGGGGGNYAPLTTDSIDDPDFSSTPATDASLPSAGGNGASPAAAGRGWGRTLSGLVGGRSRRAASMPAVMPSNMDDDDDVPDSDDEEEDADPDDEILRPGDHIYVWRNWTKAYQRHAVVISAGEEEIVDGYYSEDDEHAGADGGGEGYGSRRRDEGRYGAPPSASKWDGDGDGPAPDATPAPISAPAPTLDPATTPAPAAPEVAVAELIPGAAAVEVAVDESLIPGAAPVPTTTPPDVPDIPFAPSSGDEFELVDAYSPRPIPPPPQREARSKPEPRPESIRPLPLEPKEEPTFYSWPSSSSPSPSPSPLRSSSSDPASASRRKRRTKSNLAMNPDGTQDHTRIVVASFYPLGSKEGRGGGPTVNDVREEGAESGESLLGGDNLTGEDEDNHFGGGGSKGGAGAGLGDGLPTTSGASSLRSQLIKRETLKAFLDHAAATQDDDDGFGGGGGAASRKPWSRRKPPKKSDADMTKIHKVRYGASITRRLLSRAGTSLPLPADPRKLVLARVEYLLGRPSSLPPYHPLSANGECAAVWCRTGRWCTAQAAGILQILFVGQAGSAVVAGGVLSQLWVLVPMPGIWGVAGWFWWVPATVAYPLLIPLLVTYGMVSLVPLEILRRYRKKWKGITQSLNHGFWSTATEDVRDYFGSSDAANEDLLGRFFGPGSRPGEMDGGCDADGNGDGDGARYMPVNAAVGGPDDSDDEEDEEDEDDMIRRHEEAVAAAYRDEADLSGRPPGERGLGPIKRRVDRIMSEWKNRGKRTSQREIMEMAEKDRAASGAGISLEDDTTLL